MKLVRYPLPVIRNLEIQNFDLYKCPAKLDFSDKLNIVIGSNGLGKSTLLYIIQYSVIGPYTEGVKTRNYKGEQKTRRPIYDGDFFRLRMNEQREDATVTVQFIIGETKFIVTHSLYDNILQKVSVNSQSLQGKVVPYGKYEDWYYAPSKDASKGQLPSTLISQYHNALLEASGLPDVESLITMMTQCMFFTEDREFTFWSGDLSNTIISKYSMDQETYKKFVAEQQNVKQLDSQQRLKTYEISFIKRFLNNAETKASSDKYEYSFNDLKQVQDEMEHLSTQMSRFQHLVDKYENERIDNRVSVENIQNQIEALDLSWYKAVFPDSYQKAFNRYSRSILDGVCPFCGNEGDFSLKISECFYCKHQIDVSQPVDLTDIELKKKDLENTLKIAERNYTSVQKNLTSAKKSLDSWRKQYAEKRQTENKIKSYLDKNSDENYEKLKNLEQERDVFKAKLEEAKRSASNMLTILDQQVQNFFQEYAKVFNKYTSSFFGTSFTTRLELHGDEGEKLFQFYLNDKRRDTSKSLSESQRIFVDLAFRLSILDYFHQSSYLICETPDSTLDLMSEKKAVDTFNYFIDAGNTLFLSANVRKSNLINELIRRDSNNCNIINLFSLSSSTVSQAEELNETDLKEYLSGGKNDE